MKILGIVWLRSVIDKLQWKHDVATEEVEEVLEGKCRFRQIEKGKITGEDLYTAFGQTDAGRYLSVFFIYKANREALIVSAREMTKKEKRAHGKK